MIVYSAISPNVKLVKDLSVDEIVESVAKGLRIIDPSREYSTRLPKEMSARYRICSTLAAACQQYGYRGELGFQQFLYPNETETRKLLTWLVEALPKAEKKDEKETLGFSALLQRNIISETTDRAQEPWLPPTMLPGGLYKSGANANVSRPLHRPRQFRARLLGPRQFRARLQSRLPDSHRPILLVSVPREHAGLALPQRTRLPHVPHGQRHHPTWDRRSVGLAAQGCVCLLCARSRRMPRAPSTH